MPKTQSNYLLYRVLNTFVQLWGKLAVQAHVDVVQFGKAQWLHQKHYMIR